MPPIRSAGFPRTAIDACVERIAASPHFARSPRLSRFLRFTLESALAGRADELKERTIAVEVYGRSLAYDPRKDPIVRSEAHRLRARLAAYYAREGSADPIVIEVPKGRYVPRLRPNAVGPAEGPVGRRVVVARFEERSPRGAGAAGAEALRAALCARLAGWPGLQVVEAECREDAGRRARGHLEADFRVDGCFERAGAQCIATLRVVRLADEKEIASESERFAAGRDGELGAAAGRLAAAIGNALKRRSGPASPAQASAHELYVKGRHSAIQYGNTFDLRYLEPARRRLDAALEREPDYVDALAELAHLELLRLYPPRGETAQVLARARALLERALERDPRHARSLYLLGHLEGSALRPREALRLTESAVAIAPDDPEGRTLLAARYTSLGFWESAVTACDWALALDPVWEAPHRMRIYLLTRMGRLDDARLAIEELTRVGTSPTEVAIARFDLRMAEGDFRGALALVAGREAEFPAHQQDRRAVACALAEARLGDSGEARRQLDAHRHDGPRYWDHAIRLALALGEEAVARELIRENAINRSYRWLATEPLVRPQLRRPAWRALARELHREWRRDLEELGPRLPAAPPALPEPGALVRGG